MSEVHDGANPEATARHLLSDGPLPVVAPEPPAEAALPEALGTPLAVAPLPTLFEAETLPPPSALVGPTVLVLGASSPFGRALARAFAEVGYDVVVSARSLASAEAVAADLRLRHSVGALALELDPLAFHAHQVELEALMAALGDRLVGAVVAWGHHADAKRAEQEGSVLRRVLALNLVAPASALEPLAAHLAARGTGFLAGVCAFEGLRGSVQSRAYGAAKAGLAAYLSALRLRLAPQGVHVATLWVAPLDTRATKRGQAAGAPSPLEVARAAVRAIRRGEDEPVLPAKAKAEVLFRRLLPPAWTQSWWPR